MQLALCVCGWWEAVAGMVVARRLHVSCWTLAPVKQAHSPNARVLQRPLMRRSAGMARTWLLSQPAPWCAARRRRLLVTLGSLWHH